MAEATVVGWVTTLDSQAIDGSANVRTYPSVDHNTPKDVMTTAGCPHPSERNCLSTLASTILTGVDDIMQLNRASTIDILDSPKPEETLDRLVQSLTNSEKHCCLNHKIYLST
jgi:hypothetical protein